MIEYIFRLTERIKPYVRMTQRGKWVDPQAQEYLASKACLSWQMQQQMQANGWEMISRGIPLAVTVVIQPARHNQDLDNLTKGILDAAKGIVFEDDRWVDVIVAVRQSGGNDVADFRVVCRIEGESGDSDASI